MPLLQFLFCYELCGDCFALHLPMYNVGTSENRKIRTTWSFKLKTSHNLAYSMNVIILEKTLDLYFWLPVHLYFIMCPLSSISGKSGYQLHVNTLVCFHYPACLVIKCMPMHLSVSLNLLGFLFTINLNKFYFTVWK